MLNTDVQGLLGLNGDTEHERRQDTKSDSGTRLPGFLGRVVLDSSNSRDEFRYSCGMMLALQDNQYAFEAGSRS